MHSLLRNHDAEPCTILNEDSKSRLIFLCQHAGLNFPLSSENLGLEEIDLNTHAAYDIGTQWVAPKIAELSGATTIVANYSRLYIDVNRSVDNDFLIPSKAIDKDIQRNTNITENERRQRIDEIYQPFHQELRRHIRRIQDLGEVPIIVDLHSFTKEFYNIVRPWDIGFLWVRDNRLAKPLISWFEGEGYTVGDNCPYDSKQLVEGTLPNVADPLGLPNVLVEFSNAHIETKTGAESWCILLWDALLACLDNEHLRHIGDTSPTQYSKKRAEGYLSRVARDARNGIISS